MGIVKSFLTPIALLASLVCAGCASVQHAQRQAAHALTNTAAQVQAQAHVSVMSKNACETYLVETQWGGHDYRNPTVIATVKACVVKYDPQEYAKFFPK